MSNEFKFTASSRAWLTDSRYSLNDLQEAIRKCDHKAVIDSLCFSNCDMDVGSNPWTNAGTAEITVTLNSRESIVSAATAALQKELAEERAKWLTKQQEILDRISKLQALEYEVQS